MRIFLSSLVFYSTVFSLDAQEGQKESPDKSEPEVDLSGLRSVSSNEKAHLIKGNERFPTAAELFRATIEDDINTSSYYQLRATVQQLGLEENGTRKELQNRLRNYFGISELTQSLEKELDRIIKVRSARTAEYFTIKEIQETYVQLKGGIEVTINNYKEGVTHTIRSDELILNQNTEVFTAIGNVEYEVITPAGEEYFRGLSLSFDTKTSEGIFLSGTTSREHDTGAGPIVFTFSGEKFTRLSNDTVVLDNASITSSTDMENPNYEIKAKKMWILAPREWAFSDATLFVGRVPLLSLPFFFLPGDDLFFNPVVGVKTREGVFLNTTTYLIGRQKEEEGPFTFMRLTENSEYDQRIEGLYLKKVRPSNPVFTESNDRFLKIMIDVYSRLGAMIGIEASFPDYEGSIEWYLKAGVAASRSIFLDSSTGYTAYKTSSGIEASSVWHDSSLFGYLVPFRYGFDLEVNMASQKSRLRLGIDFFSDPNFTSDFYDRKEKMDWLSLLNIGSLNNTFPQKRSNLTWELSGRVDLISNTEGQSTSLVEELSISNINFNWFWQSRDEAGATESDPTTSFYYPSTLRAPIISGVMRGTFFQVPSIELNKSSLQESKIDKGLIYTITKLRLPRLGNVSVLQDLNSSSASNSEGSNKIDQILKSRTDIRVPEIRLNDFMAGYVNPLTFKIGYELRPQLTLEETFDSEKSISSSRVNFLPLYVTLNATQMTTISSNIDFYENFFSFGSNIIQNTTFQSRYLRGASLLDEDSDNAIWNNLVLQDLKQNRTTIDLDTEIILRPFKDILNISGSSLMYNLDLRLTSFAYNESLGSLESPVFTLRGPVWDDSGVLNHQFQGSLIFDRLSLRQHFLISSTLPPTRPDLTIKMDVTTGSVSGVVETGLMCNSAFSTSTCLQDFSESFVTKPINLTATFRLFDALSFSQNFKFDIEEKKIKRTVSFFSLGGASVHLTALDMKPLKPDGTEMSSTYQLMLQQLRVSSNNSIGPFYFWRNRISLELSLRTNWAINLQDFVNNRLSFSSAVNFVIHDFLDFSISTVSGNDRTYRYFPSYANQVYEPWVNPIEDIFNSYAFWDDHPAKLAGRLSLREKSAFKAESIALSMVHHLEDWDLTLMYIAKPMFDEAINKVVFTPTFSIFIQWLPIPEIKSRISQNLDGFTISE